MARQTINIGTSPNDGTGDPLRSAFDKTNDNFLELYEDGGVNITVNNPVTSTETTLDQALDDLNNVSGSSTLQEVIENGREFTETVGDWTNTFKVFKNEGGEVFFNVTRVNNVTGETKYIRFGDEVFEIGFQTETSAQIIGLQQDIFGIYTSDPSEPTSGCNFIIPKRISNTPFQYKLPVDKPYTTQDYISATLDDIYSLKPIIITDPLNEFCTDLATARTQAGYFGFPTPQYDYYNAETKQYIMFYDSSYIQDILVTVNSDTGDSFGNSNSVSIQDESGFIYQINGDCFIANSATTPHIFGNIIFPDLDAFRAAIFAGFKSKNTMFGNDNALKGVSFIDDRYKIEIGRLMNVAGLDFALNFKGRIDILSNEETDFSTAFVTDQVAWLHLPFSMKGSSEASTILTNLTSTVATNEIIFD